MLNTKALAASASAPKIYVEDVFSTWLYTGNSSTQTITNGIDLSGKGGLVWTKVRDYTYAHRLQDTARGIDNSLSSNDSSAQGAQGGGGISAVSSTGYTLGSFGAWNGSGFNYASWTFRKQAKFFDVVTYTGNGSNRTIAHNLGSVPGCIIVKRIDTTGGWQVYHRSLANTEYIILNDMLGKATDAARWNSTTPTSAVFSLGTDATVNASGGTYVAYLFAHDAGGFGDSGNDNVISCGSYTGNASTSGPTVTLGWEPQWLLIKRSNGGGEWVLLDNMRGIANGSTDARLFANDSTAEGSQDLISLLPTGFQLTTTNNVVNGSSDTYIYIAIRRGPMKTPTDATKVFDVTAVTQALDASNPATSNVLTDFFISRVRNNVQNWYIGDRLRGGALLYPDQTNGESSDYYRWDRQTGVRFGSLFLNSSSLSMSFFRRAPGFFDVVAYTGTGSARTVSHNLGVAPELMIVKQRNATRSWRVGATDFSKYASLQTDLAFTTASAAFVFGNDSVTVAPSASVFSIGSDAGVNASAGNMIAYLFASCPGVSKVGSYTGTGTTLDINCGFTNGARFVLIKRTDSTGDWYVWDTARGVVSGNDPYLLLNSTAVEVTNTDYIDPLSSGFQISSTAPAAINANGGSYIFLAIA